MTTATRIVMRGSQDNYEERNAANALVKPGCLLELTSDNEVKRHSSAGGRGLRWFAKEDPHRGWPRSMYDVFEDGAVVPIHAAMPGDRIAMRLPANAAAVAIGDSLVSNGDGTVIKTTTAGSHTLYASTAASTAVSNTVSTEQFYSTTYSLPANTLIAGDVLRIRGHIVVSAAAGTDTITVKVYLGGVEVAATAAVNATTGDVIYFDLLVMVRTIGATGTIVANGTVANGVLGTATALPVIKAETTLDTTAANIIRASSTWSATTATCTSAVQSLVVELSRLAPQSIIAIASEAIDNSATAAEALIIATVL